MTRLTLSELRHAPQSAADADFLHAEGFALMERMATALTGSGLVPEEYRAALTNEQTGRAVKNEAALSNCLMALCAARRLNLDPFSVMQGLRVRNGRPTWSDGLLLAGLRSCGRFADVRFEFSSTGERHETPGAGEEKEAERNAASRPGEGSAEAGVTGAAAHGAGAACGRMLPGGMEGSSPAIANMTDVPLSGEAGTSGGRCVCGLMRATDTATGRELTAGPVPPGTAASERNDEGRTEFALRHRALLLFCRLYAPDLFPDLPDDGEERVRGRSAAEISSGAPRARVTLAEIVRQAQRSREAALPAPERTEKTRPETATRTAEDVEKKQTAKEVKATDRLKDAAKARKSRVSTAGRGEGTEGEKSVPPEPEA